MGVVTSVANTQATPTHNILAQLKKVCYTSNYRAGNRNIRVEVRKVGVLICLENSDSGKTECGFDPYCFRHTSKPGKVGTADTWVIAGEMTPTVDPPVRYSCTPLV